MRRLLPLLLLFLCPPPALAGDEDAASAARERAVRSPLAVMRERAIDDALAEGPVARHRARAWIGADSLHAREAGWAVLAVHGELRDLEAALAASASRQPAEAHAAARALVALASRTPPGTGPWLPRGSLPDAACRPLAAALATRLVAEPGEAVPAAVLALGEGIVPSLAFLATDPRHGLDERAAALRALALVGSDEARAALGALVPELTGARRSPLWRAWWQAVNAVPEGPGLEAAHALAAEFAEAVDFDPWRGGLRRVHWRDREAFFRFLPRAAQAGGAVHVEAYLGWLIEAAADNPRRRLFPSLAALVVRSWLAVTPRPDDETLRSAVLCARSRWGRGWQRRAEELGEVLVLLADHRAREGVQEGLAELLEDEDLPRTVRAWALHLQGTTPRAAMVRLAEGLIDADGAAATLAQRRLGARLLGELGVPEAARIVQLAGDLDGGLRTHALAWAVRAARAGTLEPAACERLLHAALEAEDDDVFLVAAERAPEQLDPTMRERLLRLGIAGATGRRGRAWRVVARTLETADSATAPQALPGPEAALDARLRAAARARAAWAR